MSDLVSLKRLTAENILVSIGGKQIVKGAAISIEKGKITGLLGRNGSGKSTALKAIFGTMKADDINVHANGKMIRSAYSDPRLINYLPQWPLLPPGSKLRTALKHYDVQVEKVMDEFPELEQDINLKIFELSGGRERLWSTLILIYADTQFTMLDEPFTHIMPLHREQLKTVLLREKQNKGILLTDHLYHDLLDISDTIYLMKEGKSIYIKDIADLALHQYIKG
jgi:ABC-type multidrug transport system ATPase subunit